MKCSKGAQCRQNATAFPDSCLTVIIWNDLILAKASEVESNLKQLTEEQKSFYHLIRKKKYNILVARETRAK